METCSGDVEGVICADIPAMFPRHTSKRPMSDTVHRPMHQVINGHLSSILFQVATQHRPAED